MRVTHFRSASIENHKKRMRGSRSKKTVCELKRNCPSCNYPIIPRKKNECYKRFCKNCNQNKEANHLCYMKPLIEIFEQPSDKVLYVFYDFETQNKRYSEKATLHVPNLLCVLQFCTQCEGIADIDQDCEQCGIRKPSFWIDTVGDLTYLCKPRPWASRVIAIAHNAKAFHLQFILSRAILLKWRPELIMSGMQILCIEMEQLTFLDSLCFIPCPLR
jgi:DNA-directed RNA polymerase subunit M/transcription elongation factor TFIIS